jgi:transposase
VTQQRCAQPKVGVSSARHQDGAPSVKEVIQHGSAHRRRSSQSDQRRCVEYDEHGGLVGQAAFPADRGGIRELERWAKRFGQRRWAIEGASGIGRPLAQKLAASGEEVVDVPPKLSAKVRVLSTGNARKNDRLDATFTALAALRNEQLARVHPEDGLEGRVEILRLLTERRDDLVAELHPHPQPPARTTA